MVIHHVDDTFHAQAVDVVHQPQLFWRHAVLCQKRREALRDAAGLPGPGKDDADHRVYGGAAFQLLPVGTALVGDVP